MPALPSRDELLRRRLDQVTRPLHGVERSEARAIHRTRVASRRLRELLPLLQIDRDAVSKLGHRLRREARRLGAIRECDVLLQLCQDLARTRRGADRALLRVESEIRQARDEVQRRRPGDRSAAELGRVARKLEQAVRAAKRHRTDRAWRWATDARVSHRASAVRRAVESAGALYLPDRLHAVRIALKKLRYALELAADASGKLVRADVDRLKRVQRLLGDIRDRQVLVERMHRLSVPPMEAVVLRELDGLVTELEGDCRRLHARYVRSRESLTDLCRRVSARTSSSRSQKTPVRRAG